MHSSKIKKELILDKYHFKEIAISLKLIPTKEVLKSLALEFNSIENSLDFLKSIDTKNVKPLSHIYEKETFFLREDEFEENELLLQEEILNNAKYVYKDYIMLPKVVK